MGPSVEEVAFGRPATEALARLVRAAQADDPLAPVTVVVPSNLAGLTARRLLASGEIAATARGLANVSFTTPFQLAARLGGPVLATEGRVPLSNPVLGAAVRAQLGEAPGPFAPVAGHHATEQAVVRLYGELSRATPGTWAALRSTSRAWTKGVVEMVAGVVARLDDRHTEDDLAAAATGAVSGGTAAEMVGDLGTVILHLVDDLTPAFVALFGAIEQRGPFEQVSGDPVAGPDPTEVLALPDTDEEVRAALRLVMDAAESGTPLDRMAVLHPPSEPYARTLAEQFTAADVPFNGPPSRTLASTVAGRTARRLLALVDDGLTRDGVIDLVAGAPVRTPGGRRASATPWDTISRSAGVLEGAEDWIDKLQRYGAALEVDPDRNRRSLRHTSELLEFVRWLVPLVDGVPASWAGRARWAQGALDELLGADHQRSAWPDEEHDAAMAVAAAFARLAELDVIDPDASFATFARAAGDELDAPAGRHGAFGRGALIAPLSAAPGLDLEVVVIVGMAEGTFPTVRTEDALLPDADRALATEGELALRVDRQAREHRQYQAALAAGARGRVVIHPWGDHRKGRTRYPTRWLPGHGQRTESFRQHLAASVAPSSVADLDLRSLIHHVDEGGDPLDHVVGAEPAVVAGFELLAARESAAFTRFDGNLGDLERPSPLTDRPFSATRLESWAHCPRQYLLAHELGLGRVERPERIIEISPLDNGILVHEVLERFLSEVLDRGEDDRPGPGQAWSEDDRRRLLDIALEVCDDVEARGLTGRPLLWRLQRLDLLEDFARFLDHDDARRADWASSPEAVELSFGMDGADPAIIPLPDGREVAFRGKVDRVDRAPGEKAVVIDYKTSKLRRDSHWRDVESDPVARGEKLQLGLYAEAVAGDGPAATWYWFATSAGGFETIGYEYGEEERTRLRTVLTEVVDGIEAGVFPARPGEYDMFFRSHEQCGFCDFDDLCPGDRTESWVRIADDPVVRRYRDLAEGEAP